MGCGGSLPSTSTFLAGRYAFAAWYEPSFVSGASGCRQETTYRVFRYGFHQRRRVGSQAIR